MSEDEEMIMRATKIFRKVSGMIFFVLMLGLIPISIIFTYNNRYCLTQNSFKEIDDLNEQLQNLKVFENKKYLIKEELEYDLMESIDKNFLRDNPYLFNYLIIDEIVTFYIANSNALENKYPDVDFSTIYEKEYTNIDDLQKDLEKVLEDNYFYLYSSYYDYDSKRIYSIKKVHEAIFSEKDIVVLHEIINKKYKTKDELLHDIRSLISVEVTNNYTNILKSVMKSFSIYDLYFIIIYISVLILCAGSYAYLNFKNKIVTAREDDDFIDQQIVKAKENIENKDNKASPVWDLAQSILQKYYNKNLQQIQSIYFLSVVTMIIGFLLILFIVIFSIFNDFNNSILIVGSLSGVLTEFIGATFLFIYKSTIKQAMEYSKSLENINDVGMAIKIIETIDSDNDNKSKIEEAKVNISLKLLERNN